ncbi:uncharacterized protein LOC116291433 [Actinia tenebrosa]|uniref:Uncharacterized protein LOC116291433 n=1 Tax=Actinia tenebrosa TaxID=6105 RepID=A0A6P8HP81_ACTTE|nr:uncharacterized protein LOC116291433 [Actinia tenebrosa]
MAKNKIQKYLEKLYYDPKQPGSFTAPESFYRAVREKSGDKISRKQVYDWLASQETYTLHRRTRKKFKRNRIIVGRVDEQWQADLIDIQKIKKYNGGNRYILVAIDVLSKFAWREPLKAKTGECIVQGFEKIFKKGRKPEKLQTDHGKEFLNKRFQNFLAKNDIHFFTTASDTKAAIAERTIQTMKAKLYKYFTHKNTLKYTDVLQQLFDSYNDSYHTSIKTKPSMVTQENEEHIWHILYDKDLIDGPIKFEFHVGDKVRLSKLKGTFEKGLFRKALPFLASASKQAGKVALKTGANVLADAAAGQRFQDSLRNRLKESGMELKRDVTTQVKNAMNGQTGSGKKRKRGQQERSGVPQKKRKQTKAKPKRIKRKTKSKSLTTSKATKPRTFQDIFG